MATAGNWLLKLRCYNCRSVFTVRHIPGDRISVATDGTACPECGAEAEPPRGGEVIDHHFVLEILPETDGRR